MTEVCWRYLDVQFLIQILHRQREVLVPCRVQVFINHFAFVESFAIQLEFYIWVTGTWKMTHKHESMYFSIFNQYMFLRALAPHLDSWMLQLQWLGIKHEQTDHTAAADDLAWKWGQRILYNAPTD